MHFHLKKTILEQSYPILLYFCDLDLLNNLSKQYFELFFI